MTSKDLNKHVLYADTSKNEWTFSGDIWKGIDELLLSRDKEWEEQIQKVLGVYSVKAPYETEAATVSPKQFIAALKVLKL